STNFDADQPKEARQDEAQHEHGENHWLEDENDVPGIPLFRKRPEGANAIIVCEVKQDMAQPCQVGKQEQEAPAWGEIWVPRSAATQSPHCVYKTRDQRFHEHKAENRVGESAMMFKSEDRPVQAAKHIQVGGLGRQRYRGSR